MSKKIRNFAITILTLSLIIGAMSFFGNSSSSSSPKVENSLSSSKGAGLAVTEGDSQAQNDEFSAVLASIKGISIDTSIFEDPSFKALRDYPISLGTDVVGRINPFAPVGTDTAVAIAGVQFQTVQPINVTNIGATLGAQINVGGNEYLSTFFEYGQTNAFGTSTGPIPFTQNGTALFTISELLPSKKYFVRATLVNGSDTVTGNTMTFTTKAK